jgi:hypothetical protein
MFGFIVIVASVWILIGYWLWSKKQAGSKLLNLGRSRRHKVALLFGVLYMLLAIVGILFEAGTGLEEVSLVLTLLSLGVYLLLLGFSGSEIREAGIVGDGRLLKWNQIESYGWAEKTLTVRLNRRWYAFRTVLSYRVHTPHRHAVNGILARYLQEDPSRTGD